MKKLTLFIAIVSIASVFILTSCSKSSGSNSGNATFSFTANSTNNNYNDPDGMIGINSASTMAINGSDPANSNNRAILSIHPNSTGTYPFGIQTSFTLYQGSTIYTNSNPNTGGSTGSVTVNISGSSATVNFNTTIYNGSNPSDSMVITNGKYSGKYYAG